LTYVERLLGEQGQANRWLGEEILQAPEAMHAAADQSRRSMNVYGSTCPLCCGDVDAAILKTGRPAANSAAITSRPTELSRSRWLSLEMASAVAPSFGQGDRLNAPPNRQPLDPPGLGRLTPFRPSPR